MSSARQIQKFTAMLPYATSLSLLPIAWYSSLTGGWSVLLLPLVGWFLFSLGDAILGLNTINPNPDIPDQRLVWYQRLTIIWGPLQFITLFGIIWVVTSSDQLGMLEKICLFFGMGIITGTIGLNYSHELMHKKNQSKLRLSELLLAMVLYSHFKTEHLLIHHSYVGTPRDAVTAHYNESFFRYFVRVLRQTPKSAFSAEKAALARKNLPWTDLSNPFFRYWALQVLMILLALALGGWAGLGLFLWQAFIAVWQLELVNYIEHYGLTRKHLGQGKYEHVGPHHSWSAAHVASNWLLINLQRHSDHHTKPDRRFPLLQNHDEASSPQLPYGYHIMTIFAMVPSLWRHLMNPRVQQWRKMYYPEITNWQPYNKAMNPVPR
jgi:alkane 1-monooxygenase